MKNMRKLFAIILAVMMVMSLATTAFATDPAEPEETYTLTLNNAMAGHTYTAYQIFAGDLSGTTLSNIVWGSGVSAAGQTALGDAAAKAETLKTREQAEAFAAAVAPYLAAAAGSVTISDNATSGTITGLTAGYYLVQTTATSEQNGVKTYYIMKVVANTSANIKADAPEVEKTVSDSDVAIGETVTYTLTATMPSNLQGYEKYKVVFRDTLSAGLTYGSVSSVTVDGTPTTTGYTATHDNGSLTITFADVLTLGAKASSKIVVTYTATVDSDAVAGTGGNSNKVYLEYSNDPNWTGTPTEEPTGETPEEEVKVYTWEIPVFKYTGTDTPLAGAGFTLYNADGEAIKLTRVGATNVYKVDSASDVTEIVTESSGRFSIEGLAQGTYTLKETTTPAGYNTCADVTVVIGKDGALTQNGTSTQEVAIQNNSGATLPETGGMGTTLFYVFGSIMVLAAVVLLVTKKRMSIAE